MSKQPILIIIGGFAGAGKTTLSTRLAEDCKFPLFSSDAINDALRSATQQSFKEMSPLSYEVMWHLVRRQLQLGISVIVDTHMAAARTWESVDGITRDLPGVTLLPIILQATLDTHKARIDERGRTNKLHLNLGGDKLEDVMFKYDFIENLHRTDLIRVDANGNPDDVYTKVRQIINEQSV